MRRSCDIISAATGPAGAGAGSCTDSPYAYVSDLTHNGVQVIDPLTHESDTFIQDVPAPVRMASDPALRKVYALSYSGELTIIDGSTNTVEATLALPGGGSYFSTLPFAVNPNNHLVYVPHPMDDTVSVVDGRTDTLLATIPVSASPSTTAVDPSTNLAYVGTTDGVDIVNSNTNEVVGHLLPGKGIYHIVTDPCNCRIISAGNDGIYATDSRTGALIAEAEQASVSAMSLDASLGLLYVAVGPQVEVLDACTLEQVGTLPLSTTPTSYLLSSIAVDSINHLVYVVDNSKHQVYVADGGMSQELAVVPSYFDGGGLYAATTLACPGGCPKCCGGGGGGATGPTGPGACDVSRFYSVNGGATAQVIPTDTNRLTQITLPGDVHAVAGNPNTGIAYFGGPTDIFAVDAKTGEVVGDIPMGWDYLVANPCRNLLYAVTHSGIVTAIDGVSNEALTTIDLGDNLNQAVWDPCSNRLYIADATAHEILALDGETLGIAARIPLGEYEPGPLALNPVTHRLYAVTNLQFIREIDTCTNTMVGSLPTSPFNRFSDLVMNPATNTLYALNGVYGVGTVVYSGNSGGYLSETLPINAETGVLDPQTNQLYFSDGEDVTVVNGSTNEIMDTVSGLEGSLGTGLLNGCPVSCPCSPCCPNGPTGPCRCSYSAYYVSDGTMTTVNALNTVDSATAGTAGSFPLAGGPMMAGDPQNGLIYLRQGPDSVEAVDPNLRAVVATILPTLSAPLITGLAVDPALRRLYIFEEAGVLVYDTDTNEQVGFISAPGTLAFGTPNGLVDPVTHNLALFFGGYPTGCGPVQIFTPSGELVSSNPSFCGDYKDAAFSADGEKLYSIAGNLQGPDYMLHVLDTETGATNAVALPSNTIRGIGVNSENGLVYLADPSNGIYVYSPSTGAFAGPYDVGGFGSVSSSLGLTFDPGTDQILIRSTSQLKVVGASTMALVGDAPAQVPAGSFQRAAVLTQSDPCCDAMGATGPTGPTGPTGVCECCTECTNFAYVPVTGGGGGVRVVNPNTLEDIADLPVEAPVMAVPNTARCEVYVAGQAGNISMFGTPGFGLRGSIATGEDIVAMAVSAKNNKLFVSDPEGNVPIYDVASGQLLDTLSFGSPVVKFAVDTVTNMVYAGVNPSGSTQLIAIDGTTNTDLWQTGIGQAADFTLSPQRRRLYTVTAGAPGTIIRSSLSGSGLVGVLSGSLAAPDAVGVAYNYVTNLVYVSHGAPSNLVEVLDGDTLQGLGTTPVANPSDMAVDSTGNLLYVRHDGEVSVFDISTRGIYAPLEAFDYAPGTPGPPAVADCLGSLVIPAAPVPPTGLAAPLQVTLRYGSTALALAENRAVSLPVSQLAKLSLRRTAQGL